MTTLLLPSAREQDLIARGATKAELLRSAVPEIEALERELGMEA